MSRRHLADLGVTHIRLSDSWEWRQPEQGGEYQWRNSDERFRFLADAGCRCLLSLAARGPDWAVADPRQDHHVFTDLDAWEAFCRAYVRRYRDSIAVVQFGNEWDAPFWFPGTAEEFVAIFNRFARAVRTEAPGIPVALGGITCNALQILAVLQGPLKRYRDFRGDWIDVTELERRHGEQRKRAFLHRLDHVLAHADYDLLDVHLYDSPQEWPALLVGLRSRLPAARRTTPMICSEFGGPNPNWEPAEDDALHAQRLAASLAVLRATDLRQAYYFKTVMGPPGECPHWNSGLFRGREPRPGYEVFKAAVQSLRREREADTEETRAWTRRCGREVSAIHHLSDGTTLLQQEEHRFGPACVSAWSADGALLWTSCGRFAGSDAADRVLITDAPAFETVVLAGGDGNLLWRGPPGSVLRRDDADRFVLPANGKPLCAFPCRPGIYECEGWRYEFQVHGAGSESERVIGALSRAGTAVVGQAGDRCDTPLGSFVWCDGKWQQGWLNTGTYGQPIEQPNDGNDPQSSPSH